MKQTLGIDIGGSGIKGAMVDLELGDFASERHRIRTPKPATPDKVAKVVAEIAAHFGSPDSIGCTFPAIVKNGVTLSAANVDKEWIGTDAGALLSKETGANVTVVNDADAAGIAEVRYGAGKGQSGVVIMTTLGTGIGSAIFNNGVLLPNTELGHLRMNRKTAEEFASDRIRDKEELSWKRWANRLEKYYQMLEFFFSPDLIIVGGGVSKHHQKFLPHIRVKAPIVPAQLRNRAGIIGAALHNHL